MHRLSVAACFLLLALPAFIAAEEPDVLYKQGIAKLRDAQADHAALVPATKLLAQAAALYEAAGDEAKTAEINSCLYWAKKKMTLADTEEFKGEAATAKRLDAAANPVAVSEAKGMLDKAEIFAKGHAGDPLLTAIRFFEVGDRFSETAEGRKAIQQSLAAMQKVGEKAMLETYKPAATDGKAFIKSEPAGAAIILVAADGGKMNTGKITPALIQLPVGKQCLELTLKAYKPSALSVEVDGKTITKPEATMLAPMTVPVDIVFEDGWMVFVDGKPASAAGTGKAETPCTVELPLGGHELGFAKDGFMDIKQRVDVIEGGVKTAQGMPQTQVEVKSRPNKGSGTLLQYGIDLLSIIKPDRDALRGKWTFANGALSSDDSNRAAIKVPYMPPEEYDLQIAFERPSGNSSVLIFLRTPKGGEFYLNMGAYGNTRAGFGNVRGRTIDSNAASVPHQLQNKKRYVANIQIRRDSIAAYLDGKLLVQYKTDYSDLSMPNDWDFVNTGVFYLGTFQNAFRFYEVKLKPVTGTGQMVR